MTVKPEPLEKLKFEEALGKLETLVEQMENGNVPLEKLIADFEQGSKLVSLCRARLDAMERKIELLTRDDGDRGEWTSLDAEAAEEAAGDAETLF